MKALNSVDRRRLAVLGIVLAVILFAAINVLSSTVLKPARLDLTEDGLFTVSAGTAEVVSAIDEPIVVRFYLSRDLGIASPAHGNYGTRVRELLEHYASLSGGMVQLSIIDPEPYSVEEDEAVADGLQGIPLNQAGDLAYMGLVATNSTDDKQVVPFLDPAREAYLEYDLTKLVYNLANPKKPVIALISGLPIDADPLRGYRPWAIVEQMRQFFDVRVIGGEVARIDDDVDVLMLVHPKDLAGKTRYAIDQFVLGGGRALVFVDPHSEAAARAMAMRRQPGPADSQVGKLFDAWGVAFDSSRFIGDLDAAIKVNAPSQGRVVVANYVAWLGLDARHMRQGDVVTERMRRINMAAVGSLSAKEGATTKISPLIMTGPRSMQIAAEAVRMRPDPVGLLRAFKPEDKSFVVAARVRGEVETAFPDGPPKAEKEKDGGKEEKKAEAPPHLTQSKGPINLVIVADTDILSDRFWLQEQDFFGQRMVIPTANNGDFIVNVLDNLTGSDSLISLRSRGLSTRPFHRVDAIQRAAEIRYRKTEQGLLDKLRDTEKKLDGLETEKAGEAGKILTEEQKKLVHNFRSEMLLIRGQLRDVQHALRKDIEALDTWLRILNIWAMPVAISVIAIIMAVLRQRRYRQRMTAG